MRLTNLTASERDTVRRYLNAKRAELRAQAILTDSLKVKVARIIRRNGATIDAGRGQTLTVSTSETYDFPDDIKLTERRLKQRRRRAIAAGLAHRIKTTIFPVLK